MIVVFTNGFVKLAGNKAIGNHEIIGGVPKEIMGLSLLSNISRVQEMTLSIYLK